MKIVFFTDMHGHGELLEKLPAADLTLCGGDFTTLGGPEAFRKAAAAVAACRPGFLGVIGNMDCPEGEEILREGGHLLDLEGSSVQGIVLRGIGGGNKSPFGTPVEWEDADMAARLADCPASDIFVCHAPPMGSGADVIPGGAHVGSTAIADYVNRTHPTLVLCGHIHEAAGIYQMGRSFIVNPGPGACAEIEWNGGSPMIVLKKL